MDNKTWQQGTLGSTGTGRSLQTLQHQQMSSGATRSIYPGGISGLSNQTATHWQRVASCCSSLNGSASGQSQLPSHHQQPHQNQVQQQQQQTAQLRYFRVEKSSNPKYSSPVPLSSSSGGLQQQSHQQHFAQHYALLSTAPSPLSPVSASCNPLIPERTSQHKCETQSYGGCYFNPCHSSRAAATIALTVNPAEEGDINHHHHHPRNHHRHPNRNHQPNQNNQQESSQSLSGLSPAYQPRYQIIANGHFAIPATGEVSLTTTCFALTSDNATSLETSVYASTSSSSSSSLVGQVFQLPKIIPAYREPSLPRFVNAFEAVPDMLRDIRPGSPPIAPRSRQLAPFPVSQPEFSYHASKPQLSVSHEANAVATVESARDRNWPELSLRCHRSVAPILDHPGSAPTPTADKVVKTVWKKITLTEEPARERTLKSTTRRSVKQPTATLAQKSYAAAVQVTGRQDHIRERSYVDGTTMSELMSTRLRIQEARRVSGVNRATAFHTSTPNKVEARAAKKKRDYDSCEDDNEYSSTSTVSSSTNDTLSRTPERFSSPEGGTLINWRGSSSSSLQELDEEKDSIETDGHGGNAPSRKRLCKMAESFCFGQLENEAFFRAFDEYNRRRRRMSYTQRLEDGQEAKICNRDAPSAAEARKMEVFGKECNPIFQNLVYAAIQQNTMVNGHVDGNMQIRVNGIEGQGAFKVLQKLKECADGTGALYTNSWRPEELHFLRRCYQNKTV